MTFPRDPKAKAEVFRMLNDRAPELMADIAAIRAKWGGTLTYIKAGGLEYGTPSPDGWQIDAALIARVNKPKLDVLHAERMRKEKLAAQRRKSKRK